MLVRIFFRSSEFSTAVEILKTMAGLNETDGRFILFSSFYDAPIWIAGVILLFLPNSNEMTDRFKTNVRFATMIVLMIMLNMTFLNSVAKQDFLYFDF